VDAATTARGGVPGGLHGRCTRRREGWRLIQ
jgi:hypothetical protein